MIDEKWPVNWDFSDLFVIQAIFLSGPGEGAIEFGEVVIGWLADDVAVKLAQTLLVLSQGVRLVQTLLYFKVRFPVEQDACFILHIYIPVS